MTPYRKELRASKAAALARGADDGYDAIEWLATKYPACNGKVGMWGGSYSGINQYLIATSPKGTRPHLVTIAPQRALSDLYRDIVYTGGIATGSLDLVKPVTNTVWGGSYLLLPEQKVMGRTPKR